MSKTYAEVIQQIESLKGEAERLKRDEIEGVIARIKEAITVYGLTPGDLGFGSRAAAGRKSAAAAPRKGRAAKGSRGAKFRDAAGNVWGGRGPRPRWLREALASGKSLQDFAV